MLKIYRPCKSDWLTQKFGVNKACAKKDKYGNLAYPVKVVGAYDNGLCPVGYGSLYRLLGMKGHNGYDLATWFQEPVYHCAEFDGWSRSEVDSAGGIGIDIVSNEPLLYCDECKENHYVKMRYWHNDKIKIADKTPIKVGDLIALSNSTGASSGNHIHLGLKWCDKNGNGIHGNNGYYGAIDPTPYYENVCIIDVLKVKEKALTVIELTRKVIFQVRLFIQKMV